MGCGQVLAKLIGIAHPEHAQEFAELLLGRFGSLPEALNAPENERIKVLGGRYVEDIFSSVRAAINMVLHGQLAKRTLLSNEPAVLAYLRAAMAFAPTEQFRVLYLNGTNELLADEVMGIGSVSSVHVYPREVMRRCLELGATAIIVAHNHPSGRLEPSRTDQIMTRKIVEAARSLGVAVHDHILIARGGSMSFRRQGLL